MRSPEPHRNEAPCGTTRSADPVRVALWIGAAASVALAGAIRSDALPSAARSTLGPFLALGAILVLAAVAERAGLFARVARALLRDHRSGAATVATVLALTAVISASINLDVAVVVGVPVALRAARRMGASAGWLVVGVAVTANATSFLLPTSNVTNLLVLTRDPVTAGRYLGDTWLAWLGVTVLTIAASTWWIATRGNGPREVVHPPEAGPSLRAVFDLVPMFFAASGIRALLGSGLVLQGSFIAEVSKGSLLASTVDNLPAAAAVRAVGAAGLWAAILAMSIGPNLFVTGSVATVISRRIARDAGADPRVWRFTAMGAAILPLQIAVGSLGLRLVGAFR